MRREGTAIAGAIGAHVVVALVLRALPSPLAVAPRVEAPAIDIEVAAETVPTITPAPAAATIATAPAPSAAAMVAPVHEPAAAPSPAAETTQDASGDDAGWFDPLRRGASVSSTGDILAVRPPVPHEESRESVAPANSNGANRALRDALDAHDQSLGLGRAGPIVAAAHDAASASVAPDTGVAILEVDFDESGHVIGVRADRAEWGPVAREMSRLMGGKTVRVRPGSHGLHARIRVAAERVRPAGEGGGVSPGAAPDEVCDGQGITRRCVAGMPVGVTSSGHDLSNLGAKRGRVVRVQVESETDR